MKKNIISLCGAAAVLACATSAYATPTLYITDGVNAATIADGSGGDTVGLAGAIGWTGGVGSWTVNILGGLVIGPSSNPDIDLSFNDLFTGGANNTITIAFLSDGYTTGNFGGLASIGGTLGSGVTLTYQTFAQNGSTAATTFGGSTLNLAGWTGLTPLQVFTATPFSGASSGGLLPPPGGNPFELLQVVTITAPSSSRANQSSGDAHLTAVPDGGSTLMLLGSGLTALAFFRRSFKSKA